MTKPDQRLAGTGLPASVFPQKSEWIAGIDYRPINSDRTYRIAVVRKELEATRSQQYLFDDSMYFFYITNESEAK